MDSGKRSFLRRFGAGLRRVRLQTGLSQEAFAERCDLSPRYVSQLERGLQEPGLCVVGKIAGGLRVRPHVLLRRAGL
jgi:transcriptional regulator with XRE-family HTH domain